MTEDIVQVKVQHLNVRSEVQMARKTKKEATKANRSLGATAEPLLVFGGFRVSVAIVPCGTVSAVRVADLLLVAEVDLAVVVTGVP